MEIPNCFYRISVKALVLNEAKDKFLVVKEDNGHWELPGGGLEWGMDPRDELRREIKEEMGLEVTWIANHPSYFLTDLSRPKPKANILYEAKLASLNFTPSEECVEVAFVNQDDAKKLDLFENVDTLLKMFDPARHRQVTDG